MRKFLVALVILVVVLVALDRAGLYIAQREISTRVKSAYDLSERPGVSIKGFPFLTQVASGHYQRIDVTIRSDRTDGVQLQNIDAIFTGVHASLSLLLGQDAGSVTASRATGSALVPYSQVRSRLPHGVTIAPDGSVLNVAGTVSYGPVHGTVSGTVRLGVSSGGITVTPQRVSIDGKPLTLAGALASQFTFTIPVGTLPLHLRVTGVQVTSGGVLIDATARNVAFATA